MKSYSPFDTHSQSMWSNRFSVFLNQLWHGRKSPPKYLLPVICSCCAVQGLGFGLTRSKRPNLSQHAKIEIKSFIQISATLCTLAFTYSRAYYCFVIFQEIVPVFLTSQRPKHLKTSRVTILEKQQLKLLELSKK